MDEKRHYERVSDPADPRRCQHTIPSQGQCWLVGYQKDEDGPRQDKCINHGGALAQKAADNKILKNYRIAQYQQRIEEKTSSAQLKSLRDEVAILRMLIEERLNSCKDQHDLLLYSGPLSDLIMKVDKVVNSCNRLEAQLGVMLDKTQALQFAQEVVEIIGRHVEDEEAVAAISDELFQSLARLAQPKSR